MRYLLHLAKNYPFSCLLIAAIWVLCLCTPPHTPLDHVHLIDKWTHLAMYGGTCGTIWAEYLKQHGKGKRPFSWKRLLLLGWVAPILMSGLIEIIQENCTGGRRSGEWLDFAANSLGATFALGAGTLWVWYRARR